MRRILICAFMLIVMLALFGCGKDTDSSSADTDMSAIPSGGNSDAVGSVSPSSDGVENDNASLQTDGPTSPSAGTSSGSPGSSAGDSTETPGSGETPQDGAAASPDGSLAQPGAEASPDADAGSSAESSGGADVPQDTSPSDTSPAAESSPQPSGSPPDSAPSETPGSPQPSGAPPESPSPEQTPAQDDIVGLWTPVDIAWTGSEEENAAAGMLSDSLCIFNADGSFRLILPNSFLDVMQVMQDSAGGEDLLFNITNGTWARIGSAPNGNVQYSLTIPALTAFGFGSLNLQYANGFLIFEDYDQMRLARFE